MFNVLADSGTTINILSEADYKSPRPTPLLRPTKTVISGFGVKEATPVLGQFSTLLKFRGISCQADIHVIKNPEKPIIGWETCKRLKLLSANTHSVNHISNSDAQTPLPTLKLLEDYADLFNGLGKLKEKKVHLHIDENIPPIAQRYRSVPFHVRKDIEKLIAKDEKLGVIEKADGPTPWVSPIVVVPKKGQNKIRICINMRAANKDIKRKQHLTPTLNELKTILSGANVFSKLDLNQGYNQLELAEESRYITTFATHLGLYRYKRLFFSVSTPQVRYSRKKLVKHLQGSREPSTSVTTSFALDQTSKTTTKNLHAIFRRLREKGLTLNEGISPSNLKIKAILGLPDPKNASEVRSLLGMTNFCGAEFIPKLCNPHPWTTSTKKKKTQKTKQNTQWSWTERHTESLKNIKEALSRACSLTYFDPNKHTEIHTDASLVGISAVLSQNGQIVQFASRALSAVEQKYSQTEHEALAITWACEHFHIYIFGAPYTVFTDHKPLTSIFNNTRSPTISTHWTLGFENATIRHDRHYTDQAMTTQLTISAAIQHTYHQATENKKIAEEYINYILSTSTPKAMTIDEVAMETAKDKTVTTVIQAILTNKWHGVEDGNKQSNIPHSARWSCRTIICTQG